MANKKTAITKRLVAEKHAIVPAPSSHDATLAEALRRGREVVHGAESLLASYGEWLFANVFEGDTKAILDHESTHPVWTALTAAADGATLPLSRTTLAFTVRVAAYDKRLSDGAWSALGFSVKVALLPLREPKALRAAARQALASSMSVRDAKKYVVTLLGPVASPARMSPKMARNAVSRLSNQFTAGTYATKLESALNKLDDDERAKAKEKLSALVKQLQKLVKDLAPSGK